MTHGEICPVCSSKNTTDNKLGYTYDKVSKVYADWCCNDCHSDFLVIYQAEKILIDDINGNETEKIL